MRSPEAATAAGSSTARAVRASVAGSLVAKGAELVTLILLATVVPRVLGPDAYGRFAVPLTIVTLGSLALTLGGPTLVARFVPAARVEERPGVAVALARRLAIGRGLQLVVIAGVTAIAVVLDPSALPAGTTAVVGLALGLSVMTTVALLVPLGLGRTGPWVARYPVQNAVLLVAVLSLAPAAGQPGAVAAIALSTVAAAVLAVVAVRPLVAGVAPSERLPEGALRFGAFQAAGAAMLQVAQRGGVVMVALLSTSEAEAGFAALATGLALAVTYAISQAFTVSLPHLAGGSPVAAAERALRRLGLTLLAGLVPMALVAAAGLERLVPAVFGTDYDGAVDAFGPALAAMVLAPVGAVVVQAAALRLRPTVALVNGAVALSGFLAVSIATVPDQGAAGATTATLMATAAGVVFAARLVPRAVGPLLAIGSACGCLAVLAVASSA
jgi:O-antigen/teichoic acid export membrane protein